MGKMVYITHPDVEGLGGPVPEEAWSAFWSQKGWKVADADAVAQHELDSTLALSEDRTQIVVSTVPGGVDLSLSTRDELDALATSRGLNPSDYKTKADILTAL